jgi:2-C-methyl-D-erythritol 4-phosphate cytidylyltransferase
LSAAPSPRYWAVVAAAGGGARMRAGRAKQYLKVRGRSLIEHSVAPLMESPWIDGIVVVLQPGDEEFARLPLVRHWKVHAAAGGATRASSVLAGLQKVTELAKVDARTESLFVLVHDAARPCLLRSDLDRLRDEASTEQGGLLALPMADTIKRAEGTHAAATVNRRELWRAQTPQLFRLDVLRSAMVQAAEKGIDITDEASAMELAGFRPRLVPGREANIKVTFPDDLALAEFWLTHQEHER